MKKFFILLLTLGLIILVFGGAASAANEGPGNSPENPIVVNSLAGIPAGAELSVTVDECSTITTGKLTVAGNDETSYQEFRYKRDIPAEDAVSHQEWGTEERTRTFTPAQEETSHLVYSYEKTVQDTKTRYQYQKQVTGIIQQRDNGRGQWHTTGKTFGWEWWIGNNTQWSFDDVAVLQSGSHSGIQETWTQGKKQYRKQATAYQYVKNGVTEQVPSGSHKEYSGEVLNQLGSPWVLLNGYPKTVVDTEAVPESYGEWTAWTARTSGELSAPSLPDNTDVHEYRATGPVVVVDEAAVDGYTEYYVLGGDPSRNADDASWILAEQKPAGWTQFDEREVSNEDGTEPVTTYYQFDNGVECKTTEEPKETKEPKTTEKKTTPAVKAPKQQAPAAEVPTVIDAGV